MTKGKEFNVANLLAIVRNNKFLITVCMVLGLFMSMFHALNKKPEYTVSGMLQVNNSVQVNQSSNIQNILLGNQAGQTPLATLSQIEMILISSPVLLEPVIKQLGLEIMVTPKEPLYILARAFKSLRKYPQLQPAINRFYATRMLASEADGLSVKTFNVPVLKLSHAYKVIAINPTHYQLYDGKNFILSGVVGQTINSSQAGVTINVTKISVSHPTVFALTKHEMGHLVAAIAKKLIISQQDKSKKADGPDSGILEIDFSGPDVVEAAKLVNTLMRTAVEYHSSEQFVQNEKTLSFINEQLPVLEKNLSKSEAEIASYRKSSGVIVLDEQVKQKLGQLSDIDGKLVNNQATYKEFKGIYTQEHPVMLSLRKQYSELELQRTRIEQTLKVLPEKELKLISLQRKIDTDKSLYTKLLSNRQELLVLIAGNTNSIKVVNVASDQTLPDSAHGKLDVIVGIICGFIFGLFIVLVGNLRNKNDNPFLLKYLYNIKTISVVTYWPLFGERWYNFKKKYDLKLQYRLLDNVGDTTTEDILEIAMHTTLMYPNKKIINFISLDKDSGSMFLVSSLAYLLAKRDLKILVIDVTEDLTLSKFFKGNRVGLAKNIHTAISGLNILSVQTLNTLKIYSNIGIMDYYDMYDYILIHNNALSRDIGVKTSTQIAEVNYLIITPDNSLKQIGYYLSDLIHNNSIHGVIYNHNKSQFIKTAYSIKRHY